MLYLSFKDVLGRIKEDNLEVITEGDDSLLDSEELDAISEVQSYLSHDYDVAQIFQPKETPDFTFHPTIKRMVVDIMLYNLHNSRVNPRQMPENIVNKRDDAVKWLRDVANPKTNTNAPFLPKKVFPTNKNNSFSWGSKEKNSHEY